MSACHTALPGLFLSLSLFLSHSHFCFFFIKKPMDKCRAGLRWCVIDLLTQQEGSLCPHQALHWIKFHECLSIEQLIGVSINAFQAYLYLFPGFVSFFFSLFPSVTGSPGVKLANYSLQWLDRSSPCVFGQLRPTLWLIYPSQGLWFSTQSHILQTEAFLIRHCSDLIVLLGEAVKHVVCAWLW